MIKITTTALLYVVAPVFGTAILAAIVAHVRAIWTMPRSLKDLAISLEREGESRGRDIKDLTRAIHLETEARERQFREVQRDHLEYQSWAKTIFTELKDIQRSQGDIVRQHGERLARMEGAS